MSFSSINAIRASGGLGGTTRQAPATFAGPQLAPQPQPMGPVRNGSSYTIGAGMQNTGRALPGNEINRLTMGGGIGPQSSSAANANGHGVIAGVAQPSAVGPEQQMQFDPNDPNNAALAGYMAAR